MLSYIGVEVDRIDGNSPEIMRHFRVQLKNDSNGQIGYMQRRKRSIDGVVTCARLMRTFPFKRNWF